MDRPGQSSKQPRGDSGYPRVLHFPSANASGQNTFQNSDRSDNDEREYRQMIAKSSFRNSAPGEQANRPPQGNPSSSSSSRVPPSRSGGPHAMNQIPPRLNPSVSNRVITPTMAPDRSNPIAPVWDAGPGQRPRAPNIYNAHPARNVGYITTPPTLRAPGRKAGSAIAPMWNPESEPQSLNVSRMTPTSKKKRPPIQINKSTGGPAPFWQHQDADYEARQKADRRMNKLGELGYHAPFKQSSTEPPRKSYLDPAFRVIQDPGSNSDSDSDGRESPMDVDQAPEQRSLPGLALRDGRVAAKTVKAARKTKYTPATSDEDSPGTATSSTSESESDSIISLSDTDDDQGPKEADKRDPLSENEITIIEPPQPTITIPLPQIAPIPAQPPSPQHVLPDRLVAALEELSMASVRMQKTGQLPFLRKNLRRGFRIRCIALGIKTTKSKPKIPILVRYQYTESTYETYISRWLCPICELHGTFSNNEMLRCHIYWDHPEVILERWEQRTSKQGKPEWWILILIPEVIVDTSHARSYDFIPKPDDVPTKIEPQEISLSGPPPDATTIDSSATPTPAQLHQTEEPEPARLQATRAVLSPAHLSQTLPDGESRTEMRTPPIPEAGTTADRGSVTFKRSGTPGPIALKTPYPDEPPGTRSVSATPMWSARSRSVLTSTTEGTEQTLSTIRTEYTPGPAGRLYPTPPPTHDPLGPAAQPPYLPVKSEHEGPDIYYSCRPSGASLFDLLNTLPMEPFGVLDWAVLDREEEIFESDDVKDEHKIMHALWARWITLNRNQFIENYYKGTIAFVDMYWRMIHQAAGWNALRYWLLLLLAHRFLTGHEVAKVLKHYEGLTGMPYW